MLEIETIKQISEKRAYFSKEEKKNSSIVLEREQKSKTTIFVSFTQNLECGMIVCVNKFESIRMCLMVLVN